MDDALDKIRGARAEIWFDKPAETAGLSGIEAARNQSASTVLYATTKLATLITFLNHVRGIAMAGGVELETMKGVTAPFLGFHASSYGDFFQLTGIAETTRWAKEALTEVATHSPTPPQLGSPGWVISMQSTGRPSRQRVAS